MVEPTFFRTGGSTPRRTSGGRQNQSLQPLIIGVVVVAALGFALWAVLHDWGGEDTSLVGQNEPAAGGQADPGGRQPANPTPATGGGDQAVSPATIEQINEAGHVPPEPAAPERTPDQRKQQLVDKLAKAEGLMAQKEYLQARDLYNEIVDQGLPAEQNSRVVGRLTQLADETIFSFRHVPGDRATDLFTVPPGGAFWKIAKTYRVRPELLMQINRIQDAMKLRAGQKIKVINGPFNAVVDKSDFTLSVYLDLPNGDGRPHRPLLVRRLPVGLGEYNSTPTGVWKVVSMDKNPMYRHPRTNEMMAPGHKDYPFGKLGLWISLEGEYGNAVGQEGYGIHSTSDPDSIGKQASLGCVRMRDADMQEVWNLLRIADKPSKEGEEAPPHSKVTIRE